MSFQTPLPILNIFYLLFHRCQEFIVLFLYFLKVLFRFIHLNYIIQINFRQLMVILKIESFPIIWKELFLINPILKGLTSIKKAQKLSLRNRFLLLVSTSYMINKEAYLIIWSSMTFCWQYWVKLYHFQYFSYATKIFDTIFPNFLSFRLAKVAWNYVPDVYSPKINRCAF